MKPNEIFVPGGLPSVTHVTRITKEGQSPEKLLVRYLSEAGKFVSIAGPSKSGKTVLVESAIGPDLLIPLSGARIYKAEDIWERVLGWMDVPTEVSDTEKKGSKASLEVSGSGNVGVPLIATAQVGGKASGSLEKGTEVREVRKKNGLDQVVREIAGSDFVILLDDFHYISPETQVEVMRHIKEAARLKIKICVVSVLHKADAAIRANTELQGRLTILDINYWSIEELIDIATKGFKELNVEIDTESIQNFAIEAAGSPQLMQTICLNACYFLNIEETIKGDTAKKCKITVESRKKIFETTSRTIDYRTLVDVLDCGPKLRGKERKMYKFKDGSTGDVYRCVLKSIANDPPKLAFSYEEIVKRSAAICLEESPAGSSLQGSCKQMVSLAETKFAGDKVIDWNEEKDLLDIPEPYLMFYLRWSGRLEEANE
ncbi:hypothetical protein ACO0LF_17790 [Undibacterium sp. Di27W]|uniref:hypothetical protein n=1 Tax=Undibacterium sp. Di27W TaxID=3413036 RepID=UPI003BF1B30C